MTKAQGTPRFVEHGADCAHVLDDQATCNCFLSVDSEILAKTSVFHTATASGPDGVVGRFDEYAQAEINDFVASKRTRHGEEATRTSSTSLYHSLLDGEIRVLELHPGLYDGSFKGSLHVVSIDFAHLPRKEKGLNYRRYTNHAVSLTTGKPFWYTSLSYCWGQPIFDQNVHFKQGSIAITTSLANALRRLRSSEHSVFLWIDQICINQADIDEKSQQIPLMGLIYTHATNTVIWLGDDEEDTDPALAFETMENVYARLQGSDTQVTPADFERLDFPPASDRAWWTVRQLLRRPWFSRLWTIQEAVLSPNLFLQCGEAVANWEDFAAWCIYFDESGLLRWLTTNTALELEFSKGGAAASLPPQGASIVNSIQADRLHGMTHVQREYLLNILVSTRYASAFEPKDKIYGVLGMAETTVTPNYSPAVTARQVYHEACLTQLPRDIYELLSCIDHDTPLQPSWIPDWSAPRVTEALGYSTKAWTLYCAGGRPLTGQPPTVILSDDQKTVTLSGKFFDTIRTVGSVSEEPILDIDNPQAENQKLTSYLKLIRNTIVDETYPVPNSTIYDAFFHTLLAGRDGTAVASPSTDHSEVFSLILDSTTGQMPSLPGQTYSPRRAKGFFTLNSLKTRKPANTLDDLRTALRAALKMRRFAITSKGYFALVPRGAREGDDFVVFEGACVPFVVRRVSGVPRDAEGYELLGEAYVHGVMKGEVMGQEKVGLRHVTLV